MDSIDIKKPDTSFELNPLIAKRWSPRSFSEKMMAVSLIEEIFEAARWAPSANNEQPWQYVFARRGTDGFNELLDCLSGGNQPWAKSASVLFVALSRDFFLRNGKKNRWAHHDLGLANAQLLIQAASRDIYGHLMAGFDHEKVVKLLGLADGVRPVCMGALGYLGDPSSLEEPYKTRELTERSRRPLSEILSER